MSKETDPTWLYMNVKIICTSPALLNGYWGGLWFENNLSEEVQRFNAIQFVDSAGDKFKIVELDPVQAQAETKIEDQNPVALHTKLPVIVPPIITPPPVDHAKSLPKPQTQNQSRPRPPIVDKSQI